LLLVVAEVELAGLALVEVVSAVGVAALEPVTAEVPLVLAVAEDSMAVRALETRRTTRREAAGADRQVVV
jgi:hypothetical protein